MKIRLLFSLFALLMYTSINAQITTVGVIGSATPGGWDTDTDMVQDPDSAHLWTLTMDLIVGEAKFRANDAWDINWGDTDFPIGVGTQGGPNIPIAASGTYDVTFNSKTGEYYFNLDSDIGIIGSATPFGWNADISMYQDAVDTNLYRITLDLIAGEAKFRADDAWDVNWGSADFPTGVGVQNGPNIPIPNAGTYEITFNRATGEYSFNALLIISTVGIIGDATPGGSVATPMTQNGNDWFWVGTLTDGGLQFSINDGEAIWGGTDFPSGTVTNETDNIPVTAGDYLIVLNAATGEYTFYVIENFSTIGIIGDATPGGWDTDTDMVQDAQDSALWSLRIVLTDGEAKFRANDDWVVNWGSGEFPTGTAVRDGPNIPVTAGEYIVTFNSVTGAYNFRLLIVFDRIGIVGTATPNASWDVDVFLTQDNNNEDLWYMPSVDITDGFLKFRADSAWTVNWGTNSFPSGIGTQDGPNIPTVAGTYGITFNSATGEFAFVDPFVGTKDLLDPSRVLAYPNPANEELVLDITAAQLRGTIKLNIFDINGKLMLTEARQAADLLKLNVSYLPNGYYTLHISNDKYLIGKKFVIAR